MNNEEMRSADGIPGADVEVVRWLAELGVARQADEQAGGGLWADFGDWCWVQSVPKSHEAFEVFLTTRSRRPSPDKLRRVVDLLGPRPDGRRS